LVANIFGSLKDTKLLQNWLQ